MNKHGKKYRKVKEQFDKESLLLRDALGKIKDLSFVKFDESVDVAVNLGIDPSKGDQVVRGSVALPHGTGKQVKILVFATGPKVDEAKAAGADYVGFDDLVKKISDGWVDFDYAVATPDLMPKLGVLAKILGPKGLLPNKKLGTVTDDVAEIVSELKKGKAFFKNDKYGLIHFSIGKVSFDGDKLHENFKEFFKVLTASKPATSKGQFVRKVTLSSTMGVGIPVDVADLA
ncbi:MAG: 50S ribosomal protein L1 [Epsilonproteobacteria bacterium]|nr:50S ribosomal protein L1 [Campylobacterota bacterium]|tara:strand:+ start:179 stop:868 length:690 start_codon:yes stop_codon:yes gene_type:complete